MQKISLKNKQSIFAGKGLNKSMMFAASLGIGVLDMTISNILNSISSTIHANNESPLYEKNLYNTSNASIRIGNSFNKSSVAYW